MLTKKNAEALLTWAGQHGRNVPWRSLTDAYRLGIAEVLLQKTKAVDAIPVWSALVTAYKTPKALASAPANELLTIVSKLGLGNQRVLRLKQMASSMLTKHKLQELAGLGSYGSAILALAQGSEPVTAPVDGNIARVVCRYLGLSFKRGEPRKKKEVHQAVMMLLGLFNQPTTKLCLVYALVDLGDSVCRPHNPSCGACPVSGSCALAAALNAP
jgi:A/G-specific adenine glycosylase